MSWLTITAGGSGQGDGVVQYNAAQNVDPVTRNGGIMVNGLRAQVTQSAGECRFELATTSQSFGQVGGSGRVDVRASSALCTWTASSDADWITITSGTTGKGSGPVAFTVASTTGPPRAGTLTVAGLRFNVSQAEGCTFAIAPTTYAAGAAGGSNAIAVTASPGCPWTASSDVDWISISTTTGTGNGTVAFTVAPTSGPSRTGTLTVAGQIFTVTQSPGCAFEVAPLGHSVEPSGGTRSVSVSGAAGCAWTAASNDSWITITGATSGSGSGTVTFAIAATTGPSRSGTLTVAGQTVSVSQGQGCTFALSPATQNVGAGGGTGTVTVTVGSGCAWNASSNQDWLTITGGASGTGPGTINFRAASTSGPSRSATISVAGQTATIVQSQGCRFDISPDAQSLPAAGGEVTVAVSAGGGCAWTARSNTDWISIVSGASGSGNGNVRVRAAGTTGPARSGTATIAGQTFTINQGTGCSVSLSSSSTTMGSGGGTGSFDVRSADGCAWTATSNATSWLTITSGASGAGNGTVRFSAAANPGAQRSGAINVGGQTFTVTQEAGCSYAIDPTTQNVGAGGGPLSVGVTAGPGCAWTATSNAGWIIVSSGPGGSGNGTVQLTVTASNEGERRGTVTIANQTFTVVQSSGCTFSLAPTGQSTPAAGGTGSFTVNTAGGCGWTAGSTFPWIAVTTASGTGPGPVQFTVAANSGPARSGTITAAGQTFTINQDAGCAPSVSPETITSPAAGGPQTVTVTTTPECSWTAGSNAPWIAVTPGGGAGTGTVQITVGANTGPVRSGTATIAGRTVTVNQESGCTFAISPLAQPMPVTGGTGSVVVTTADGCSWTAASNAGWIIVTAGANVVGPGTVQYTVEANGSGSPRLGTITIAGQPFVVAQAGPDNSGPGARIRR